MSGYIGATGYSENQEQFDTLKDEIDANASYINNLVGIPDPTHTAIFGINILNPGLFGLVERAEVNISLLQSSLETEGTTITSIQSEVSGIQSEILGIQGEITGIDSSISSIQFVQLPALSTSLAILIGATDIIAVDARNKANKALGIWDEDGNNTYNMKSGNVGIGILPKGTLLTNKLEVNGDINIPLSSNYKINNQPLNYSHLAGTPPVSSKWTNSTDVATNIYYNTGNVGIGVPTAINNKLEIGGNLNISAGSKYKINNVDLAFSDLGTLSYNSLSDKPTLFDGNYNSLSNKPTLFDGNYNSLTNKLTAGTNINIIGNAINNTYTLPTAGLGSGGVLGGVRVDNSTIFINGSGVISSAAGTPQVNSDWTQTNTSLKSFIQNKPTAGTNISFAGNTITNIITGSPTQNIIDLNNNYLIVKDKPDTQIVTNVDVPLTSGNEPTITSPAFTESIRAFTHSGGTEEQTTHTITVGQNTICDILIVGGGGGGSSGHGGGGGAGQLVLIHQAILSGTYTIKVGKGGLGGISTSEVISRHATKGINSEFGTVIAEGGGANGATASDKNGGSGAGGDGYSTDGGTTSGGNKDTTIDIYPNATVYTRGNNGGNNGGPNVGVFIGINGGGGGGAGENGTTSSTSSPFGKGGDGLSGISDINYDFKTNFGTNVGKTESDGLVWFAGGGGGGSGNEVGAGAGSGGKGGGGNGAYGPNVNAVNGLINTGSGGGGGSGQNGDGGDGGSGIVIIKFKSIVGAAIPEGNPITHKTLNFAYSPNYPYIQADNTNLIVWYKFDDPTNLGKDEFNRRNLINTSVTTTSDLIGTSASFTNETYLSIANFNLNFDNTITTTGISFSFWFKLDAGSEYYGHLFTWGTHNTLEKFALIRYNLELKLTIQQGTNLPNTFDILAYNTWIHLVINIDTSRVLRVYQNTILVYTLTLTPSLYSGLTTSSPFTLGRATGVGQHDYRGGIEDFRIYNKVLTSTEITQLYNIPTQNTYTLSVQSGTSIQVNNGTAQYLSGNYTITVGATQSSVVKSGIGQVGSDPYPSQNGSTIAIRYSMLQRITSTINIKKDGLIKYVPASGTNPTTGTWNIIDLDTQPLTQFAGNLPANRLDNIDMSKVATGNLDWSRIASQPALSSLAGNLPLNRTDGNLPASRLDNIDMSKVATGNLDQSRLNNLYIPITNQFHRIVYAWDNVVDTQGIWTNKFKINTNLHLNQYNHAYNYYQYFLSMSPNNVQDRHKYWFGTVKMSTIVGTDNPANTQWYYITSNASLNFDIKGTSSTSGVWWLDIWVYTAAYCESLIAILH